MVVTNFGASRVAMLLGGSAVDLPTYFMIGSGSGTALVTETVLIAPLDRQIYTSGADLSTTQKVTYSSYWNALEMSGINLSEFGITYSGTGTTGSMWSITRFPSRSFTGNSELQIQETWEVVNA